MGQSKDAIEFAEIANKKFGYQVHHDIDFYVYEQAAKEYAAQFKGEQELLPLSDEEIEALAQEEMNQDAILKMVRVFNFKDLISYGVEKFIKGYKAAIK
jgi:hypothetical protein